MACVRLCVQTACGAPTLKRALLAQNRVSLGWPAGFEGGCATPRLDLRRLWPPRSERLVHLRAFGFPPLNSCPLHADKKGSCFLVASQSSKLGLAPLLGRADIPVSQSSALVGRVLELSGGAGGKAFNWKLGGGKIKPASIPSGVKPRGSASWSFPPSSTSLRVKNAPGLCQASRSRAHRPVFGAPLILIIGERRC